MVTKRPNPATPLMAPSNSVKRPGTFENKWRIVNPTSVCAASNVNFAGAANAAVATVRAAEWSGLPRPVGLSFVALRLIQNLLLFGLSYAFYRKLGIPAYSALMVFYVPLPLSDATRATRLHLLGMWLTFAVSALMIAWFVLRMTRLIRLRDAELAATREQALRDERIIAIGTLAAGAAHELGTPLGTMALLAGELARDPQLPDAAREDIALLRQQIVACKEIITGLSRRAGAERLENPGIQPVDRWLDAVRQRWHAVRPQAQSRLETSGAQPAPARDASL